MEVLPAPGRGGLAPQAGAQGTFDELGTPLHEVTFVVVDLETTGGSPADSEITEFGAVKVRGGEVLGEFQTLVDPGRPIPAFIAVLTGITDSMVAGSPRIEGALPAFLEFARGSVLVAHNAPFDTSFLKAACLRLGHPWPGFTVLDTARLARQVLTRDETPSCKLSHLARFFRSPVEPNHRALTDAQATVDVLHGLMERVGNHGVHALEELLTFSSRVSPHQHRKRHLAEGLPRRPGVYLFRDARGQVLYVGKSKDLRSRVRSYFTASETRTRMVEMVGLAETVTPIVCATALEAEVRELRLIAEHKPRYNRRSRFPERAVWVKLTDEAFPRLSQVRQVRPDAATYLGPFSSTRQAELASAAIHEAFPLRQCRSRLSARGGGSACALYEMGRCHAPCEGRESVEDYAAHVEAVRAAVSGDARELVAVLTRRIRRLSDSERFEDAALHRDRLAAFLRVADRLQRLVALTSCPQLVAARPTPDGAWELAVVRHGRLAATGVAARGVDPRPLAAALVDSAEVVTPGFGPTPAASAEETECVLRWLDHTGTRLVSLEGTWSCPAYGAGGQREVVDVSDDARVASRPLDDHRRLRTAHQPSGTASRIAG